MNIRNEKFIIREWDDENLDAMDALAGLIALSRHNFPRNFAPVVWQHTETLLQNAGRSTRDSRHDNASSKWVIAHHLN